MKAYEGIKIENTTQETQYCNNFEYDLKIAQVQEKLLAEILQEKKIEVKDCRNAKHNVFIEYYCSKRMKKSGISSTKADYYAIILKKSIVIIETEKLKQKIKKYFFTVYDVSGGEGGYAKGVSLPISELIK